MGLFGSSKTAAGYNPAALSGSDKLMLFGAMLRDLGSGQGPQTLMGTQDLLAGRQALARKQAAENEVGAMFAPQGVPTAPPAMAARSIPSTGTGAPALNLPQIDAAPQARMPSIADPATIQRLMRIKAAGVDIAPIMEAMKANQPQWQVGPDGRPYNQRAAEAPGQFANPTVVGNTPMNINDPSTWGKPVPQLDKGMVQGPDGRVTPMPGYVDSASAITAGQEAAKAAIGNYYAGPNARAEAAGRAPYDFISTPTPNGAPQVMSKSSAAGGVFTGQAPTDAARATATTQAAIGLPAVIDQAKSTLDLIGKVKNDPALAMRTGAFSVLPAIPGTAGVDFESRVSQLKGKAFLDAYNALKGAGQISEIEGAKATDAQARLSTAQTPKAFKEALDDMEGVIRTSIARAQKQAGQGAPSATSGAPPRSAIEAELRRRGLIK